MLQNRSLKLANPNEICLNEGFFFEDLLTERFFINFAPIKTFYPSSFYLNSVATREFTVFYYSEQFSVCYDWCNRQETWLKISICAKTHVFSSEKKNYSLVAKNELIALITPLRGRFHYSVFFSTFPKNKTFNRDHKMDRKKMLATQNKSKFTLFCFLYFETVCEFTTVKCSSQLTKITETISFGSLLFFVFFSFISNQHLNTNYCFCFNLISLSVVRVKNKCIKNPLCKFCLL